ncbi:MAG: DUF1080 domain-containing protein [Planctomycetaceae bacterium]|jgi:hypothetical protein|nr:DUF1080 domain-containing protein [Planctomycetaceae bacterium]
MMKRFSLLLLLPFFLSPCLTLAADNELTPEEQKEGWLLLFNGKDYTGWINNNGKPVVSQVEDGAMQTYKCGGYILTYDKLFGDFILTCDVKMDKTCNSGIFLRIEDRKDPVNTGFEIQVGTTGEKLDVHAHGALYDVKAPSKAAGKEPGEWDHFEIKFAGSELSVKLNGEEVVKANLDDYSEPGKRDIDGNHKFTKDGKPRALKDFARTGSIGFQDHDHKCWYKNVKLLPLEKK